MRRVLTKVETVPQKASKAPERAFPVGANAVSRRAESRKDDGGRRGWEGGRVRGDFNVKFWTRQLCGATYGLTKTGGLFSVKSFSASEPPLLHGIDKDEGGGRAQATKGEKGISERRC